MRMTTLNCWCGRAVGDLIPFFERRRHFTDLWLLQEVLDGDQTVTDRRHPGWGLYADLFNAIARAMPEFDGYFAGFDDPNRMSNAIFVRRSIPVLGLAEHTVYEPENPVHEGHAIISDRKLQTITLDVNGKAVLFGNLHGLWFNGPKTDTPDRLAQSEKTAAVLNAHAGA